VLPGRTPAAVAVAVLESISEHSPRMVSVLVTRYAPPPWMASSSTGRSSPSGIQYLAHVHAAAQALAAQRLVVVQVGVVRQAQHWV